MENRKFLKAAIRIFIAFAIAFALSFIPENFHQFFGDTYCQGRQLIDGQYKGCDVEHLYSDHLPTWHYGFRHYLWALMGCALFALQIISIFPNNENE